jgi:hypothetical protein
MLAWDVVRARGHALVKAKHKSTFEITTEKSLTPRGDCIVAIEADKSACTLAPNFKELASGDTSRMVIVLDSGGVTDVVRARGSSLLTFEDAKSVVVRRSSYVDARTVAIMSDKAAADLSRKLVSNLKSGAELLAVFVVYEHCSEDEALAMALRILWTAREG